MSQGLIRVQHVARLINGFPFSSEDFLDANGMPLIRIRDLQASEPSTFVDPALVPAEVVIRKGDVVIGMDGDFNSVFWDREPGAMNQRVCLLRAIGSNDPRFIAYALPQKLRAINEVTYSTTVKHLSSWDVEHIKISRLSPQAQRAVANYLDRETGKIDALIEKQVAFIDGLHARRRAVIAKAFDELTVDFAPLTRFLSGIKDGTHGSFSRVSPESGSPLLSAKNIRSGRLFVGLEESYISEKDKTAIVANGFPKVGDVLLVVVGATIGKTAIYHFDKPYAFQRSVAFLRPSKLLDSKFLWYQIQSRRFQEELWNRANVSAQPGVYLGSVSRVPIKVPSLGAQESVVTYLDEKTARIDDLIGKSERLIGLSRERRTALITAAVTGQIDVAQVETLEGAA